MNSRKIGWTVLLLSIGAAALVGLVMVFMAISSGRVTNEQMPWVPLMAIADAQSAFRSNDSDGNGKKDYWREDIAGLYAIMPKGSTSETAIKLIDLSIACADAQPRNAIDRHWPRSPKAGYWYKSLRYPSEKSPNPDLFAACAFPENLSCGKFMFLITEKRTLYSKEISRIEPLETCPEDPEKEGWVKISK